MASIGLIGTYNEETDQIEGGELAYILVTLGSFILLYPFTIVKNFTTIRVIKISFTNFSILLT